MPYVFRTINVKATTDKVKRAAEQKPRILDLLSRRKAEEAAIEAGIGPIYHPRWRFQYVDWTGRKRTATGTTSKAETERIALVVQAEKDKVRKLKIKAPPKLSDVPRAIDDVIHEYLDWGKSQGGRGGHAWGEIHAFKRDSSLMWWKEHLGLLNLSDLDGILSRVERTIRELQAKGRAGKTIKNRVEALAAFCHWCKTRDFLAEDPLTGIAPIDATPTIRRRALTPDEIGKLLNVAPMPRRIVYGVALCTGLRKGELRSLRARHLDVEHGGLILEAAWTKNRKPGFQHLPGPLLAQLAKLAKDKKQEDILLAVPFHAAREFWKDIRAAGIPKWTAEGKADFHALRATYATLVIESGATVKEAQALLRHSSPELTMNTYARTRDERLARIVETVGEKVESLGTTEAQRPADPPQPVDTSANTTRGCTTRRASTVGGSNPLISTSLPLHFE